MVGPIIYLTNSQTVLMMSALLPRDPLLLLPAACYYVLVGLLDSESYVVEYALSAAARRQRELAGHLAALGTLQNGIILNCKLI